MAERKIRLNDEILDKLLDKLDANTVTPVARNKGGKKERGFERPKGARKDDRYTYRIRAMKVEIEQPGAPAVRHSVPSRNISSTGCSFLIGNFVYPNTRCTLHLMNSRNNWEAAQATVVRCRYLEGSCSVFEVGVRFLQPIDVARFSPQAVHSSVLVIDESAPMQRVIARMLESSNVRLTCITSAEEGVRLALDSPFDLILIDMDMPGGSAFDAVKRLREQGYHGVIAGSSGSTAEDVRDRCIKAGCTSLVSKPFTRKALEDQIRSIQDQSLLSTLAEESDLVELIDAFVADLKPRLTELLRLYRENALDSLECATRVLKSEAGTFGFGPICDAAANLERLILQKSDKSALEAGLAELVRLCALAKPATGSCL